MVVRFVALEVMPIIELRPFAKGNRLAGELMEGLAQELGAGAPDSDVTGFAATDGNRGDAAESLQMVGILPSVAASSESGDEPRNRGGAGAGERRENRSVGVIGGDGRNPLLERGDLFPEHAQLTEECGSLAAACLE